MEIKVGDTVNALVFPGDKIVGVVVRIIGKIVAIQTNTGTIVCTHVLLCLKV